MKEYTMARDWLSGNYQSLIRTGAILGIPLLAAALGWFASLEVALILGVVIGGFVALIVLTRVPELGLLAIIPVSFFGRWEIGTGRAVSINLTIVLLAAQLGVWLVYMFVYEKRVSLVASRANLPALGFILAVTLSLLTGSAPWLPQASVRASLPAQVGGWLLYAFSAGLLLLTGNRLRSISWLRVLTWTYLLFGGLVVASYYLPGGRLIYSQLSPGVEGAMFWSWLGVLAMGQALFNRDLPLKWRGLMVLIVIAQLAARLTPERRDWVSGWLPLLAALLVMFWLYSWRWGLFTAAAALCIVLIYFTVFQQALWTPTEQYSVSSRLATWPIMFQIFEINPLFGLGPSNYYYYTPLFSLWGYYVKFNSHNNYFDILAQTGLIGFTFFCWLIIELVRMGLTLIQKVKDGFTRGYAAAALAGMAAMLVSGWMGDWFLPFLYNIGFPGFRASVFAWLFLGGLLALSHFHSSPFDEETAGSNLMV